MNSLSQKRAAPGVALIGCGYWGMNHLRVWREMGQLRVVYDMDVERLRRVALETDVPTADQLDAVLEREDVNGVVIATPAVTHAELVLRTLQAGKDVLVEKPMAMTAADGVRLVQEANRNSRILCVGHVLEYHPAVIALKHLVDEGALGRLQHMYANRLNLGRIRLEENALWSFAPHDVAIMLRLWGSPPEDVVCHGRAFLSEGVADVTMTYLRFSRTVQAHIFVSWLHPFKEHRLVVIGDQQMAVFDDTAPWSSKLVLYPHRVEWLHGRVPVARKAEGVPVPLEEREPLRSECEAFSEAMVSRRPPLTDGTSGLRVLEVLELSQRSLERDGELMHASNPS